MKSHQVALIASGLLLTYACSAGGDISRSFDISADRLAEIKNKPYAPGNGPGGFATASLSGPDDNWPVGIRFTGFGPYLYAMGFTKDMMVTAINGVGANEVFAGRWQGLRLQDPGAFDAAHYKDLIEFIFIEQPADHVVISVDVNASRMAVKAGIHQPKIEKWRINFLR